jgi:hypothetical protein
VRAALIASNKLIAQDVACVPGGHGAPQALPRRRLIMYASPMSFRTCACAVFLLALSSCLHGYIAGTAVVDTPSNREVYQIIHRARQALQERDAATLLSLISTRYFEDNGTVDPRDDYGYTELKERLLKDSMDTAKEVYVSFDVHEIVAHGDYAYADVRYTSRTRLDLPAGRLWDTHGDFDRIELRREDQSWKIISGL